MRVRQANQGNRLEDPPSMFDHRATGKNDWLASDVERHVLLQMTLVGVGPVTSLKYYRQA